MYFHWGITGSTVVEDVKTTGNLHFEPEAKCLLDIADIGNQIVPFT
jgi:hypothetical protein